MNTQNKNDHLTECCLVYADRLGHRVRQESSPAYFERDFRFDGLDFSIEARVSANPRGNGRCSVKVTVDGEVVFRSDGSFTVRPFGTRVTCHVRGESWEKSIRSFAEPIINDFR